MSKKMSLVRGFTLIELLIVVAIIAILAAIAVPNFIEAQVRSKVSRAKTDMRSQATALEAYMVDGNTYPPFRFSNGTAYWGYGQTALTTPIAYITSLPKDPFQTGARGFSTADQTQLWGGVYEVVTGSTKALPGSGGRGNPGTPVVPASDWIPWPKDMYLMITMGPDRSDQTTTQRFPTDFGWNKEHNKYEPCLIYDASNGSTSMGEIFRLVVAPRYQIIFDVGYDPDNGVDPTAGAYETWRS